MYSSLIYVIGCVILYFMLVLAFIRNYSGQEKDDEENVAGKLINFGLVAIFIVALSLFSWYGILVFVTAEILHTLFRHYHL